MSEKKEYIERGAFIDFIDAGHLRYATEKVFSENDLVKMISERPAADVEPVVRGEWKDRCVRDWVCSLCGCEIQKVRFYDGYRYTSLPDFCPDCGAVMTEAGLKKIAERSGSGE